MYVCNHGNVEPYSGSEFEVDSFRCRVDHSPETPSLQALSLAALLPSIYPNPEPYIQELPLSANPLNHCTAKTPNKLLKPKPKKGVFIFKNTKPSRKKTPSLATAASIFGCWSHCVEWGP